jgi:tRNA nucleotidyltransferase (CCA-adding enzyme)
VTPLDASITFHDDPLRVLRAIRFAVRYNLTLSDEIINAAKSPEVHKSLHVKISRERIGKELEGMLSGKNARPCVALKYITDLKLAGCVFEFPHDEAFTVHGILHGVDYGVCVDTELLSNAREMAWLESTAMVRCTTKVLESFQIFFSQYDGERTGLDSRILYLASFLHPLRKMVVTDSRGKQQSLPSFIMRDSIKFKNKDIQAVAAVLSNVDEMRNVLMRNGTNDDFCRLQVGLVLRNLKEQWVTTLLVVTIAETQSREEDKEYAQQIVTRTIHLYSTIQSHNLDGCWKVRPLLDGKDILQRLDLPRGPAIAPYIDAQIRWMLLNPSGHKEELIVHLKRKRDLESSDNVASKVHDK